MLIERTDKEIIIRLGVSIDTDKLNDLLNYARYQELTSKFKVSQKQVDALSKTINKKWWAKNQKRILG